MESCVLGITGGEQHGNSGHLPLRLAGKFRSPQGARHHDIGEEQVDRGAAFDNNQSAVGIFRSQHIIAQFRQHFRCRHPYILVVLDKQNGLRAAYNRASAQLDLRILILSAARQIDPHGRALAELAENLDMSTGLFDKAVDHAQAQPGSPPLRLGAEKRIEYLFEYLRVDATAGIGDGNHYVLPRRHLDVTQGVIVVQKGVADFYRQFSVAVHRVAGIDHQIEQSGFDLHRVNAGVPKPTRKHSLDLDPLTKGPSEHVVRIANEASKIDDLRRERLPPREGEQLRGEFRASPNRLKHALDTPMKFVVTGYLDRQHFEV